MKNLLKNKIFVFIILSLVLVGTISGFSYFYQKDNISKKTPITERKSIGVSMFSYQELVETVAGDQFEVFLIAPDQSDPHDFEPSSKDVAKILEADVLFYNGEIDNWLETIIENNNYEGKVFKAMDYVELLEDEEGDHEDEGEDKENKDEKEDHKDPHIWVSPLKMLNVVTAFDDFISKNFELQKTENEKLLSYEKSLSNFDTELKSIASCSTSPALVSHRAFDYLEKDYNIEMLGLSGLFSAEVESKINQEIINQITEKQIKTIFFDPNTSRAEVDVLAKELNIQVLIELPSLEISLEEANSHLASMQIMVNNLRTGLCGLDA
jgi:zinc transport system substrate-binding protein